MFVTVNENPLKIASSCIREKLCATHAAPLILRCLRKRMNNCHHTSCSSFSSSSSCFSSSSQLSDVRSYLFVIASSDVYHHFVGTQIHSATQSRPPCTPSRLACQTSSVLCGIEILDEIAPSSILVVAANALTECKIVERTPPPHPKPEDTCDFLTLSNCALKRCDYIQMHSNVSFPVRLI